MAQACLTAGQPWIGRDRQLLSPTQALALQHDAARPDAPSAPSWTAAWGIAQDEIMRLVKKRQKAGAAEHAEAATEPDKDK